MQKKWVNLPQKEINRKEILANLLTLPIEERDSILNEHCQIIKSEFESNSEEMEWVNEYEQDNIETVILGLGLVVQFPSSLLSEN